MNDLISRHALMKEFSDFVRASNSSDFAQKPTWNDAVSLVGSMPSAQTEITRCHECAKRRTLDCPMGITVFDAPPSDGYCYKAERRNDG